MLRQKNADRFHQHAKDLGMFLRTTFKEDEKLKKLLTLVLHKQRQMDQTDYLNSVLSNLEPHYTLISQGDEFLFTPEYQKRPLFFLYGLDFKRIWQHVKTSEDKRIVFRFLKLMYIQGSTAVGKNKDRVKELAGAIQMEDQIAKEAKENPDMFDDNKFKALFGEDDVLFDLAQDISQEFNLAEMLGGAIDPNDLQQAMQGGNPAEIFQKMSQNPKMRESMAKVAKRTQEKMQEKNVTQEDLINSFNQMRDNLGKNVKGPMGAQIKKMMKNFDLESMSQNMAQQFGNQPQLQQSQIDSSQQHPNMLPNQETEESVNPEQNPTLAPDQSQAPPNPFADPAFQSLLQNLPGQNPNQPPPTPDQLQQLMQNMLNPTQTPTQTPVQTPTSTIEEQDPEPTKEQDSTTQDPAD